MSRICLIDDHAIVRSSLCQALTSAGHEIVGEAAGLRDLKVSPDELGAEIILLDLHLESEDGLDVLRSLAASGNKAHVIVLTMSAQPWHVRTAFELGAKGYVLKGSPLGELLAAITSVSAGMKYEDPRLRLLGDTDSLGRLKKLSRRERQIIDLVAQGLTSAAIGRTLFLSPKTVDTYRSRIMTKLEVDSLADLIKFAVRHGIVKSD